MPKSEADKKVQTFDSGTFAIRDTRRPREESKQTFQLIEKELQAMIHNARNPLSTALYNIEILEEIVESENGNPELEEVLRVLRETILQVGAIIGTPIPSLEQALGRVPIRLAHSDLTTMTKQVIAKFLDRGRIKSRIASDIRAFADTQHFPEIIYNLIDNALKFCDQEKAQVEVSLFKIGKKVFILIQDNGPGFEEDDTEKVFTEGYRSPSTAHIPGSGRGLYYCKRIVDQYGGTIHAANRIGGEGAIVSIELLTTPF